MPTLPVPKRTGVELPISGGRRATAEDFGGGADFGGKQIASAAVAYLNESEESEARKALVASSEIRARYARELDAAAMDGRDLGKLKEQMQDDLAKVGDGFQTKRGVDSLALYTSNTELMYDEQANAISVRRAYTEAQGQGQKLLNSVGAELQRDPTQVKNAEKTLSEFLGTFRNLRPEQRAELEDRWHKSVNVTAMLSRARANPAATRAALEAGEGNLTPEQRSQLIGETDRFENVQRAADERERVRVERERLDEATSTYDKYAQRILKGENGKGLYNEIVQDPAFAHHPRMREHLAVFMRADAQRIAGQEKQSNPRVKNDLYLAATAPDGDPRRIYNADSIHAALAKGDLNATDSEFLRGVVARQRDSNFRAIDARLNGMMSDFGRALSTNTLVQGLSAVNPSLIPEIQQEYRARVEERMEALRKTGEKGENPAQVFDRTSKHYVGPGPFTQGIVEEILAKTQKQAVAEATTKGAVDLRKEPDAWQKLADGALFIDPRGLPNTMTPALRAALKAQGAATASANETDRAAWMAATGGALKPAQTQEQAIAAWKAGR